MRRSIEIPTPADVFFDPVVQLAALCPICALAALRPEAAIAALAPGLVLFNPALNPVAASLSFALDPLVVRLARRAQGRGWPGGAGREDRRVRMDVGARPDQVVREERPHAAWRQGAVSGHGAVFRSAGVVVRPGAVSAGSSGPVFRTARRA
ncbi:MAG: hypothetical protein AB2385_01715 [Symbiobacterium sp.]|uniref:hypothetical protein n=1 Tax=Symbiobacterium sp. TaxID=1971213 RepID=UPI0034649C9B